MSSIAWICEASYLLWKVGVITVALFTYLH